VGASLAKFDWSNLKVGVKKIELVYFAVLFLILALIFAFNMWAGGTITSPQTLANDLWAPPDSPQDWQVQNLALVRYRAVFRFIVRGTWSLLFAPSDALAFYATFVTWSFVFFFCAVITFYFYLRTLDFDRRTSFVGGLIFLASAPVLLAYKYPVFTREDPLAYWLVLLGLIAVFQAKPWWMSAIAVIAVLTRETTLIVPLAYFAASDDPWRKKLVVCLPPAFGLMSLRLLWGGEMGNPFESSQLNFLFPWETLAFLFCTFGALWLLYFAGMRERWRSATQTRGWKILTRSGPLVLLAVLTSTLVISRAREIRITFILFPWVIAFALDWLKNHSADLRALIARPVFWFFAAIILTTISASVLYLHLTHDAMLRYYLADFKNGYWLVIGTLNLSALLALLVPLFHRSSLTQKDIANTNPGKEN
jgi:hypothetical protein